MYRERYKRKMNKEKRIEGDERENESNTMKHTTTGRRSTRRHSGKMNERGKHNTRSGKRKRV